MLSKRSQVKRVQNMHLYRVLEQESYNYRHQINSCLGRRLEGEMIKRGISPIFGCQQYHMIQHLTCTLKTGTFFRM